MLKEVLHFRKRWLFIEKLFALEGGEETIKFFFRAWNDLAEETQGELAPNDGQLLHEGFLFTRQSVDAGRQYPLHGGGDMEGARCVLQSVLAALAAEHALF